MARAVSGFGTRFEVYAPIALNSRNYSWQIVAGITDIPSLPDPQPEFAEWHAYDGSGAMSIQPTGRTQTAEFEITIKYNPTVTRMHKYLRQQYDKKETIHWRIIKADQKGKEGFVYISSFVENTPPDNTNEATIGFKVDGLIMEF